MTDLKTLKDIPSCEKICCGEGFHCDECVRQEAINWVKHYKQKAIGSIDTPHSRDTNGAKMSVLIEFANIKEEELK